MIDWQSDSLPLPSIANTSPITSLEPLVNYSPAFNNLPDELLQSIFDFTKKRIPLVNKRILPFYRAQSYPGLYRDVKVNSHTKFGQLARTLSLNPQFGSLIETLEIDGKRGRRDSEIAGPTTPQLFTMFANLPNLTSLIIINSGAAIEVFFKTNSLRCGPNLQQLHLDGSFYGSDPFAVPNLISIANRQKIKRLELLLESNSKSMKLGPNPFLKLAYPSIKSIALSGALSASNSARTIFVGSRPEIVSLIDISHELNLPSILSSFCAPQLVKKLSISLPSSSEPHDFRKELLKFTSLTHLEIVGAACGVGSPFYNALRKLPLTSLTFGRNTDVSLTELKHLITGQKKHSTLQELVLNNIFSYRGGRFSRQEESEWIAPQWTRKFTLKGMEELVAAGRVERISFKGSSMGCLTYKQAFNNALVWAKDRTNEINWVRNKTGAKWDEAEEILERRDARNGMDDSGYGGSCGYDDDEESEEDEEDEEESSVWLT